MNASKLARILIGVWPLIQSLMVLLLIADMSFSYWGLFGFEWELKAFLFDGFLVMFLWVDLKAQR